MLTNKDVISLDENYFTVATSLKKSHYTTYLILVRQTLLKSTYDIKSGY